MKGFAIKISTDNEIVVVEDANTLEQLQEAVGGYVERVSATLNGVRIDMWVNEDGIALRLPLNRLGTKIYHTWPNAKRAMLPILGNVIITGGTDSQGETLPLTPPDTTEVLAWLLDKADVFPSLSIEATH